MFSKRYFLAGTLIVAACQGWSFELVESYGHGYVGSEGNEYGYIQLGPVNKVAGDDPVLSSLEQWMQTGPLHETKADIVVGSEIAGTWQMDRRIPIFEFTVVDQVYRGFGSLMNCRIITNDDPDDSMRFVWFSSPTGGIEPTDFISWPDFFFASANYWGGSDDLGAYDIRLETPSFLSTSAVDPRYQRHWLLLFEPGTTADGGRLLTYVGGIEYGEYINAGVPEPASLAVLGFGALGLLLRRRGKR